MTAYDAVLKVKAIAVSSGMARSLRTSPSARQMERRTRTTGQANYLLPVTITAVAPNQPPITLFCRNPEVGDQQLRQTVQGLPIRCRNARAELLLHVARLTTDEGLSASIVQAE